MSDDKQYMRKFVKLNCAADLLAAKVFPNAKEITESMGCFHAVESCLLDDIIKFKNPNIVVCVIGDGTKPRTGMLFAMRTAWTVYSIDPMLDMTWCYPVRRLFTINKKIEDYKEGTNFTKPIIIILPHSHAKMVDVLARLKTTNVRHIVSIPCCVLHEIDGKKYIGYQDSGIWSEKNTVKVWKNV